MGFQPLKTVINIVLFVLFCVFFLLLIYSLFSLYPLLIRRYATCWQTKIHYVNIICAVYVLDYSCMNDVLCRNESQRFSLPYYYYCRGVDVSSSFNNI